MAMVFDDTAANETATLARLKENVATSYLYFQDNYERFRNFRTYVFKESVNDQQRAFLRKLVRPIVEFNILEAPISSLMGEFAAHEPSISVTPSEGVPVNQQVIDLVEGSFRQGLYEANKNSFSYEVYRDLLSGGFSVGKVRTGYTSPMSFKQNIYIEKAFDSTLCGFDPIARDSHKGDGQYCFEIYPMTDKDFERTFVGKSIENIKYNVVKNNKDIEGFSWSYKDIKDNKIILVAEYWEKKKQRTRIVELADGTVMTQAKYKKMQKLWVEENIVEQIPIIKGKPRWTILETICRYVFCDNQILEYEETDYSYLPLVFIDGNSIILTSGKVNSTYQMTRPMIYHAKGTQDLKNFAGQALANYLQNMVQHKFIIKKEAIVQDQDSLEAIKNIQRMNNIVINAYSENNPDKPIPEPIREVVPVPAPAEIMGAFQVSDPTTQTILSGFASNMAKNDNDLSGKAVVETLSAGQTAAMPYVVGYLNGLTQIANIWVDLMPKYLLGKRTIPVRDKAGQHDYIAINDNDGLKLDYEERALKVNIEPGVNFRIQKNRAVEQIIALMKSSEELSAFFNSPGGMKILAKNLEIHGADNLEEAIEEFMQHQQEQQQQQMQMQQQMQQSDPAFIRAQAELQKVQLEKERDALQGQLDIAKQATADKLADAKILEAEAKISQAQVDSAVRLEESNMSIERHALDAAAKIAEVKGREHDQILKTHEAMLKETQMHHDMNKGDNENV
jgi:hypothetical protein